MLVKQSAADREYKKPNIALSFLSHIRVYQTRIVMLSFLILVFLPSFSSSGSIEQAAVPRPAAVQMLALLPPAPVYLTLPPSSNLTSAPALVEIAVTDIASSLCLPSSPPPSSNPTLILSLALFPTSPVEPSPLGPVVLARRSPFLLPTSLPSSRAAVAPPSPMTGFPFPTSILSPSRAEAVLLPSPTATKLSLTSSSPTTLPSTLKPRRASRPVKSSHGRPVPVRSSVPAFIGPRLPSSPIGSNNGTEVFIGSLFLCRPEHRPVVHRFKAPKPSCLFGPTFVNGRPLHPRVSCSVPVETPFSLFFAEGPEYDLGPILARAAEDRVRIEVLVLSDLESQTQTEPSLHQPVWYKVFGTLFTALFAFALYLGPPVDSETEVKDNLFGDALDLITEQYVVASEMVEAFMPPVPDSIGDTFDFVSSGTSTYLNIVVDSLTWAWFAFIAKVTAAISAVPVVLGHSVKLIISGLKTILDYLAVSAKAAITRLIGLLHAVRGIVHSGFRIAWGSGAKAGAKVVELGGVVASMRPSFSFRRPDVNVVSAGEPSKSPKKKRRSPGKKGAKKPIGDIEEGDPAPAPAPLPTRLKAIPGLRKVAGKRVGMARPVRDVASAASSQ
ncbi:hypothetical protein DXG01_015738 [Tephrocybe rancida]|nr:hypothetical protein DXG01_015738 [Tephrocybe rancida]